jgi:hypothetical protein
MTEYEQATRLADQLDESMMDALVMADWALAAQELLRSLALENQQLKNTWTRKGVKLDAKFIKQCQEKGADHRPYK